MPRDLDTPMARIPVMGLVSGLLTVIAASSAAWSPVKAQPVADAKSAYLRIGAGVQWPESSLLTDQNCSSTNPPALFGCGRGNDGDRLGADGAFRQLAPSGNRLRRIWPLATAGRHGFAPKLC